MPRLTDKRKLLDSNVSALVPKQNTDLAKQPQSLQLHLIKTTTTITTTTSEEVERRTSKRSKRCRGN